MNGASIKPYVVATGATLAGEPYLGSIGGGLTMHLNFANVALDPYAEFRSMKLWHAFRALPLGVGAGWYIGDDRTAGCRSDH